MTMATLTIKNEIRVPRDCEWIARGVPFPRGVLEEPSALRLTDASGAVAPLGTTVLGRWPGGAVKWVLLQFPVSFAGEGTQTYMLNWSGGGEAADSGPNVRLTQGPNRWEVDNGRLRFALPLAGPTFITDLSRDGEAVLAAVRAQITDGAGGVFVSELCGEPVIEHCTDKMLVVSHRGAHRSADGGKFFACDFRVTVFAGAEDLELEYQFIHACYPTDTLLDRLALSGRAACCQPG